MKLERLKRISNYLTNAMYVFAIILLLGALGCVWVLENMPYEPIGIFGFVSVVPFIIGVFGFMLSWMLLDIVNWLIKKSSS